MANFEKKIYSPQGKIIRDVVHGDIFVEKRYVEIIDCPEFQRLRRIKQLSVGNLVFPSADHTRFSHSLGTFFVMTKIIEHFENQFKEMNVEIKQRDKEVALVAALLHDIGHGPFSHAYENIHPIKEKNIDHETWTVEIIRNGKVLSQKLKDIFDVDFSEEVISLIENQHVAKKKSGNIEIDNFFTILSSLISSQLDADRLDYLLRDSTHTGVSFGKIDIFRIINSLRISVVGDEYCVCIPEKYVPDIENYLLARYQMYKGVYYHSLKVEMEIIIKKIFLRAYNLHQNKKLSYIPKIIEKVFSNNKLTVDDYIQLDDMVMYSTFMEWKREEDEIISELCSSLHNRKKYKRIKILDGTIESIDLFKRNLENLIFTNSKMVVDIEKSYFWIQEKAKFTIYKNQKKNIWVSLSDGTYQDISNVSKIIHSEENSSNIMKYEENLTYINYGILKMEMKLDDNKKFEKDFDNLLEMYDSRNHVEIEKKYFFGDESTFGKIQNYLEKSEYDLYGEEAFNQVDSYYDTTDEKVKSLNSTIRIREKKDELKITIKKPTISAKNDIETQSVRFEHEKVVDSINISDHKEYIMHHLDLTEDEIDNLALKLTINNDRKRINISQNEVVFEVVFDNVKYINDNGQEASEKQLEIELKSDYPHRVNLKILSDDLEKHIEELKISKESKYVRGRLLTKGK